MLHGIVHCKSVLPSECLSTRLARINKEAGKMDCLQVIPNFWRSLGLEGGAKGTLVVPALMLKVNILVEICLGRFQACSFFQACKRASSKSCCQRGSWEVCSIFQSNPSGTEDPRPDQPVQQERTEESPRSAGLWNLSVYSECLKYEIQKEWMFWSSWLKQLIIVFSEMCLLISAVQKVKRRRRDFFAA